MRAKSGTGRPEGSLYGELMDEARLFDVLDDAVAAVRAALDELDDWGPAGTRPGQYRLDLAADDAALPILQGAGLAVLSEESGLTGDGPSGLLAVIDPIDGSTNAHRGVPFYSTSICVLDAEGPLAGLVVNQDSGTRYAATRGGGAERDGRAVKPSGCEELGQAIVGISGFPGLHAGWAQFRALGAASLECCAVAEGVLDAYLTVGRSTLYGWDYLAGLLVCQEAGAIAAERDGRALIVRDAASRRPVVAATAALAAQLAQIDAL
jgi:fructose-1,6-bisphosphatase/inositol monophosphatase family enzyme